MATTVVGGYALAVIATPANGDDLDADAVRAQLNAVRAQFVAHDAEGGLHLQSGLASACPPAAAGNAGWKWLSTDNGRVTYSDGAAWQEIGYLPLSGGTLTGGLSVRSSLSVSAAAGSSLVGILATGDTVNRIAFNNAATPTIFFGPGGASATDTSLSRDAAGTLRVGTILLVGASDPGGSEALRVNGAARATGGFVAQTTLGTVLFSIFGPGDTQPRVYLTSGGVSFGGGSLAADCSITRTASGVLTLFSTLVVGVDPTGAEVLRVGGGGRFGGGLVATTLAVTSATTSTSATTGAATALPALPAGYWSVDVNGATKKVPYYN